jgi:hypothetical protein
MQILEINDICTLTLYQRIAAIFKYLPVMATTVSEGHNNEKNQYVQKMGT